MAGKKNSKEDFDRVWLEWKSEPDEPRKKRLLNQIVKSNYPLVQKFVDRLMRRTAVYCDYDDAMQAGLIGLITALKKYDPSRPTRFSTMCFPWIRHEVSNMTVRQTQIYRPKGTGMPYQEHRKCEIFDATHGREAEAVDIGVTTEQLEKWQAVIFHYIPIDEIREKVSDDNWTVQLDRLRAGPALQDSAKPADEQMIEMEFNNRLVKAVASLSDDERRAMNNQYIRDDVRDAIGAKIRKFLNDY